MILFFKVDGFRELLRMRDNLSTQLDKAEKERTKLLEDKSKAASSTASGNKGFMSRFTKSEGDLVRVSSRYIFHSLTHLLFIYLFIYLFLFVLAASLSIYLCMRFMITTIIL